MILEIILTFTGVAAVASLANLFIKNKELPKDSISIKKYMPGNLPIITLYNSGIPFNFLLDTGSNICHICPSVLKNIKIYKWKENNIQTTGLGSESSQSKSCSAKFVDSLNKEYDIDLVVSKEFEHSASNIEAFIGVKINGLLGTDFLQKYKYTIDFKTLEVYVKK